MSYRGSGAAGVDLDLEVFQSLREGVEKNSFVDDHVRIGIPFPRGIVTESGGCPSLAVPGREYQTKVLKLWPDGSVQWALVEFLASPAKGKSEHVRLADGPGASPGKTLAMEKSGVIHVDTGPLQVDISREDFNIFQRVAVKGQEIIRQGSSRGIVLTDGDGREYVASRCRDTRVIIEENGPVKSTIRVDGGHCGDKGRLLDFTMRLFFIKGKSDVTVQYTLRNASSKSVSHVLVKSLDLETRISIKEPGTVNVNTHKGERSFDLRNGDLAFYQAVSDFPWMSDGDQFYYQGPIEPDYSREQQRGYSDEGYRVVQAGKLALKGKRSEFPDLGFLDMSDAKGLGLTAGVRHMAGQWPKALRGDAQGKIQVSLWPVENKKGYWIRYGSHNTFEVMYHFHFHTDGSASPREAMSRFQYPLAARAPIDWYNRNVEGIYPLYHFISFRDEEKLAAKLGAEYGIGWRKTAFKVWRYHYWGHGAFLNQHDFGRIALVNALRDDRDLLKAGESYLYAESIFNYYADWGVYHSDDYDYAAQQYAAKENRDKADLAKVVFDWEHSHWYGMPLWYYMTGDERIREAVLDWGEYVKRQANPLSMNYMRVFACGIFSLAALYEFTGDAEYKRLADLNFRRLLEAKYSPPAPPPTIFIDWERGYVAGGSGSGWPGVKADLMFGSLLYDGLLNYYQQMKANDPLKSDASRLLAKMSEFMYREPYFEGTKRGHWAYWIPYVYDLTDREKSDHNYRLIGQATFWTVLPYETTGDNRWIERMKKMMKMALWDESGVWGSYGYLDHPGFQTIGYYLNRLYFPERYR